MQMRRHERTVAVGAFDDYRDAVRAVEMLRQSGFRDDQIGIARRGEKETISDTGTGAKDVGKGAAAGAATGGVAGGVLGALAAGLIPGIGPVIAGGILASVLGGAAIGAGAGGIVGALVKEGVPEEEARGYESEFKAGRTIVMVKAADRFDEAQNILAQCGAMGQQFAGQYGATGGQFAESRPTGGQYAQGTPSGNWNDVSPTYRADWERQHGTTGRWEDVEPPYRYGYEMANDPRYRGRSWEDVEPNLRSDYPGWSTRNNYRSTSKWDDIKENIREAFDRVRGRGEPEPQTRERGGTVRREGSYEESGTRRMPIREEQLTPRKEEHRAGEVELTKDVVEEERTMRVPVTHEEVDIETRRVEPRPASEAPHEDALRIPITEENVEVSKEPMVTGEIEMQKREVTEEREVGGRVRKEVPHVEKQGELKSEDEEPRRER